MHDASDIFSLSLIFFKKKGVFLFSKEIFNGLKVTVKTCIMLQNISVSNKYF